MTTHEWVIGIDLGGTKTALALIDPQNQIRAQERLATEAERGPEYIVEQIGQVTERFRQQIPTGDILRAMGVGAPGPLDHVQGVIINPTNLPKFYNTPLAAMLQARTGVPVCLEHDAKAAALGEMQYGAGRGVRDLVYIVVGTGVGAAIVMDGELVRGVKNFAGEIGHITLDWQQGEPCACGSRGCAESYMSGPWLERRYARLKPDHPLTGGEIAQQAQAGETEALQVLEQAGAALGAVVATMAMTLDIEWYIIGGSVVKAGDIFLNAARRSAPRYSFVSVGPHLRIVGAELGEAGAMLGAGWLARQLPAL
jgi:glucokinase